ncbi:reverse transcriptase/maturase family protein [Thiohalophilus sp.]|uniref:reverse transcriptase/maturase family protein n=1 Tax=Thiohalophilus sp. TaxID=3028392 RepID=UPI002ACE810E|nr:reverse transcriptase/maturase family protein [Thiohalophilus sp.]MDZ7804352.1 reverse transcriptase/maturase family protein [Thiohalophilus sp.]
MPVTANGLWDELISWDNLVQAYQDARRGKRYKPDVLRFHRHWEERLLNIHNHLVWGSWQPQPFSAFPVYEPKERLIEAPAFADRVVHHALHRIVEPHFERRFIHHSYACRKGKGTHAACHAVQRLLRRGQRRWGKVFVLQADIRRYFPHIRHDRLLQQIRQTISDPRAVDLWAQIITANGADGVGLPIGALTSQLGANLYLDELDHHVTDHLGHGSYVRYMDDWIILGPDKQQLKALLGNEQTGSVPNWGCGYPNGPIYPAAQGIDFAGYRTWASHIKPRKRNTRRARRRLRQLTAGYTAGRVDLQTLHASAASFVGYTKHCQGRVTMEGILAELSNIYGNTTLTG